MRKIINSIECFFESIAKVFKWIPVIWKDRDWDEAYFWRIVEMKLSTMEDLFENYGSGINSKKDAKKIRTMKNLAKRIHSHLYLWNALIPVEQQFGKTSYRPTCKIEEEAIERAYKKSDAMEQQDLDMFCQMLNKHVRSFWD